MTKESFVHGSIDKCSSFLQKALTETGLNGYVIGLSGGIDSSLSASLAVRAVGADKVLGLFMPFRTSSPQSLEDASLLAVQLKIKTRRIEISPMIEAYFDEITPELRIRAGNKMARERMSILFDVANEIGSLVLGTGNRTEICLGYTTLYGDSACSVNPLGELYKTEVRTMARALSVPERIIAKPPTADLWVDQTDEGEIGVTYDMIDRILRRIVDEGITSKALLLEEGFSEENVTRVVELLNRNAFKRNLPQTAQLGRKAVPNRVELKS